MVHLLAKRLSEFEIVFHNFTFSWQNFISYNILKIYNWDLSQNTLAQNCWIIWPSDHITSAYVCKILDAALNKHQLLFFPKCFKLLNYNFPFKPVFPKQSLLGNSVCQMCEFSIFVFTLGKTTFSLPSKTSLPVLCPYNDLSLFSCFENCFFLVCVCASVEMLKTWQDSLFLFWKALFSASSIWTTSTKQL